MPAPTPTTPSGSIAGRVLKDGGLPLGGASVNIAGSATAFQRTGGDGGYLFSGLPAGVYTVSVGPMQLFAPTSPASVPVTLAPGGAATVNFTNAAKAKPATPPPVAPPAVIPAPTLLTGLTCGTGPTRGPVANYVGAAPFSAWLDCLAVSNTTADRRRWNPGDGSGLTYVGEVVNHVYETPGTYHPTCTIANPDGTTSVYGQTVTVTPDDRKPILLPAGVSAATFAAAVQDGTHVTLAGDVAGTLAGPVRIPNHCVVDAVAGVVPTITVAGCSAFDAADNTTSDALLRGFRVTSAGVPSVKNGVAVTLAPAGAKVASVRGYGVTFDYVTVGNLQYGIYVLDGDACGTLRCKQEQSGGVAAQVWSQWAGGRAVVRGNTFLGVLNEALARMDGPQSGRGVSIEGNTLGQWDGNGKPPIDIRNGDRIVVANNQIDGGAAQGQLSTSRESDSTNWVRSILYQGNTLVRSNHTHGPHLTDMVIDGGSIAPIGDAPAVTLTQDAAGDMSGVTVKNLPAGTRVKASAPINNFVTDCRVTGNGGQTIREPVATAAAVVFPVSAPVAVPAAK